MKATITCISISLNASECLLYMDMTFKYASLVAPEKAGKIPSKMSQLMLEML